MEAKKISLGFSAPAPTPTASKFETFKLNNGHDIPCLGLGTYLVKNKAHISIAMSAAYDAGYRLIDTARMYENEPFIGQMLQYLYKRRGAKREEFFLTTKVLPAETSYKGVFASVEKSLTALRTDYIDMLLIHWPTEDVKGRVGAWKAMQELCGKGTVRNIGVSNFLKVHLDSILTREDTMVRPCVNQMEVHPLYIDQPTIDYCAKNNIMVESYSPFRRNSIELLENEMMGRIAAAHAKSVAQVVLRWHHQRGFVVLPKSVNAEHVRENACIFDFVLSDAEMKDIEGLNRMSKVSWDPHSIDE